MTEAFISGISSTIRAILKKLSYARRRWLKRKSERYLRALRTRRRRLERRKEPLPFDEAVDPSLKREVSFYRDGKMRTAFVSEARQIPAVLDLQENYEPTVAFLRSLRATLTERWQAWMTRRDVRARARTELLKGQPPHFPRYWDFSQITKLSPEVALIIAAELDAVTRNMQGVFSGAIEIEKWKPSIVRLLNDVGFFELTKVVPPSETILSGQDWKILRFKSASVVDGREVKNLLLSLGLDVLLNNSEVFDAIAEAITNTKHHAYKGHSLPAPVIEDWWMTGFIIPKRRRVSISVWDRGLTIPATLPSWERYPIVQRAFRRALGRDEDMTSSRFDGSAIRVAMAAGRSSTALDNRGKGLPLIESIVSLCASGHLRIHSRNGTYERIKGRKPRAISRNCELGGTLITWDWQFHAE